MYADKDVEREVTPPTLIQDLLASFAKHFQRRIPAERMFRPTVNQNVRPLVDNGSYSPVPDPIRSSDFTTRPSRMPIAYGIHLQPYFAVMRDDFLYEMELEPNGAAVPVGEHNPWVERSNISRPPAVSYGGMVIMQPNDPALTFRKGGI